MGAGLESVLQVLEKRGLLDRVQTLVVDKVQLHLGPAMPRVEEVNPRAQARQRKLTAEEIEAAKLQAFEAIQYGASEAADLPD